MSRPGHFGIIGATFGCVRIPSRIAVLAVAMCCTVLPAWAQTPTITSVQPLALKPGETNELRLAGQNLSGATELWMSFPGIELKPNFDTNSSFSTQLVCRVHVPKTAPVGVGAFRVATTNGITPFRLFMLDDLPAITESATNKTIGAAQAIKPPCAVDGHTDEITFDYFKLPARKGDYVSFEVVAQRIGSSLDSVLRLLDGNGREIAYCDDDPRVGRDSRLRCKIPATGTYLVEVRDINYGGGQAFHYRLRVGDFPLTSMPYPPVQNAGSNATVAILSSHEKSLPEAKTRMPPDTARISVPVRTRRNGGSSFVSLFSTDAPQIVEKEPNDATNAATSVSVPCGVSGRFEQPKDVDVFRFAAAKDQRVVFRARNRSLGSPCDLFMAIQDANGATVAEYDPTLPDEGTITNRFKSAGEYYLVLEELNQTGGPDLGYHVSMEEWQPGFALSVEVCEHQGRAGESVTAKVTATRHGYDGPIELVAESARALTADKAVIPEKKNEGEMKVTVPADARAGTCIPLRIEGRAKIGEQVIRATASTLPALRKLWPNLRHPPAELDGLIAIGVRAAEPKPAGEKTAKKE